MPTYAPHSKDDCCPFSVYVCRKINGMREEWSTSPKGQCLQHNHAPRTAKQKKFLSSVNLFRENTDLITHLAQSFRTPRHVMNFMRRWGVELTAKDVQNIYDGKEYFSTLDSHELVTRLDKKRNQHGWYMNVVKDVNSNLTHVFWMSVEQIAIARCFLHLRFHDNT